jgi:hypothetical protein
MTPPSRSRTTATTAAVAPAAPVRKTRIKKGQTTAARTAPAAAATTYALTRKTHAKTDAAAVASVPAPRKRPVKHVAPTRLLALVPAFKKKRTGLQGTVDTSTPLVVGAPLDCILVHFDPAQNMDMCFVLKLIENEDKI